MSFKAYELYKEYEKDKYQTPIQKKVERVLAQTPEISEGREEETQEMSEATEQIINTLEEQMETLGIELVDISVYHATKSSHDTPYEIVIAAGHIPNKAGVFTINCNVGSFNDCKFSITGQLIEEKASNEERFSDIPRNSVGHESFGQDNFYINHYESDSGTPLMDKIRHGKSFFENFINAYGSALTENFTQPIHPWFVPEYSDELKELEEKNGKNNTKNYEQFNTKVIAKFPKDFFSPDQKP